MSAGGRLTSRVTSDGGRANGIDGCAHATSSGDCARASEIGDHVTGGDLVGNLTLRGNASGPAFDYIDRDQMIQQPLYRDGNLKISILGILGSIDLALSV